MLFGAASVVVNQLFIAFARTEWVLYLGLLFGCHGWCTSTLCRSRLYLTQPPPYDTGAQLARDLEGFKS